MTDSVSTKRAWQSAETVYVRAPEFPLRVRLLKWVGKQSWIPRGHDRLLRTIWNPESSRHFCFEIDFFGKKYRGDLAHLIDWVVFSYGASPLAELMLLEELAKQFKAERKQVTFFDIGANVGHHSLFMSGVADRVYSFEPFPAVRSLLEDKISSNKLDNVTVFPVGLGYEDIELSYYPAAGHNSGSGTFIAPSDADEEYSEPIRLPIRNGDCLFDEFQLPRLDLLKVDVEGFEASVFRGLAQRIRRDRPAILTEWSKKSTAGAPTEKDLRALFYEDAFFAEVGGRLGRPFKLSPFRFGHSEEVLIVPSEHAGLIRDLLS